MIDLAEAELRSHVIRAMAHPVRLVVMEQLRGGDCPFSTIHKLFHLDKSTVSKHLLVLKQAGIVSSRREGADMVYWLTIPCITDFFGCVTAIIENHVEKEQRCLGLRRTADGIGEKANIPELHETV